MDATQKVLDQPKLADKDGKEHTNGPPALSFTVSGVIKESASSGSFSINNYCLINSVILDSGSPMHIFNDISRFEDFHRPDTDTVVVAGDTECSIEGYGRVNIHVKGPNGPRPISLEHVAYIPGFATNVASLRKFYDKGVDWNIRANRLLYQGEVLWRSIHMNPAHLALQISWSNIRNGSVYIQDI
ncbi:hypothetical protein V1508DRAFT_463615 [Lipomyces doorenjongii]|uniref:uncharacterized protein n=1 Tax=Lipomyces doorenjongii TaxID=383834 RepID=UPI0034CDFE43